LKVKKAKMPKNKNGLILNVPIVEEVNEREKEKRHEKE